MPMSARPPAARTLLIGGSGQLGRALADRFADCGLMTASNAHARAGEIRIDLGNAPDTRAALEAAQPDLILVAGAMCNVDQCEVEPERCDRTNLEGPAVVAEYARTHDVRAVFFSTDHVFDGMKAEYVESDPVNPLNAYASSKARAESVMRATLPDRHVIIRTGWLYGPDWQRRNFVLRLVDRLRGGEWVTVPADQWGSPTHVDDVALAVRHLIDRGQIGTFHATGPTFMSRSELAELVCEYFGLDAGRLVRRHTADLGQTARRPLRVLLNCQKLAAVGVARFRSVADGLTALAASS